MGYIHGYSAREAERLSDQAAILRPFLHRGLRFPAGSRVLEPGCGSGRQSLALLEDNPGIHLTCLDVDAGQLELARERLAGWERSLRFVHGDLGRDPLTGEVFDHAFVCFLLEHLRQPEAALARLRGMLRAGGTLTLIEGDHGSFRFQPETPASRAVWDALIAEQRRLGGDPMIGRRLRGLLTASGFSEVSVAPILIHADAGDPLLREGFMRRIIVPMVDGVRASAVAGGFDARLWERGIEDLLAVDSGNGSFYYLFFEAVGSKGAHGESG
ncbi:methyltransferase [Thiorhodococcus fuscus]|uniref:Methyltransferase n=1 Tax=Thiorhodococcus fuscus TaxID=527200 RepID=A0ABW4Y831_9GAMM